ncbi:conserved membrane family protein [Mycobacterium avium subsp. avium 2285 (R)]|nr:conserved membrane family protein [Mycobacterium avium subsp. avium 2285 (R)]
MKGFSIASLVKRGWMVLVVVVVVGVAGFCVYRLHGIFGSHNNTSAAGGISDQTEPFSPKHITLEVFGNPGAVATINYVDINVQPRQVLNAALPWSLTMVTTQPGPSATWWRRATAIRSAVASRWTVTSRTKGSSTR